MKLTHKLSIILLAVSFGAFAQTDSTSKHRSVKGQLCVNAGIGESTIFTFLYSGQQAPLYNLSRSLVYNSMVDYGVSDKVMVGIGSAYQSGTGSPEAMHELGYTENFTRLNISARILYVVYSTRNMQVYCGFRGGVSYWTDVVTPTPSAGSTVQTTIGNNIAYPSVQAPIGIRLFAGPVGFHVEAALGTPYFMEGGISFRF
jgi:hypothetical protein